MDTPRWEPRDDADEAAVATLVADRERQVRPAVVKRVGEAIATGTYDPPVELLVERLVSILGPGGSRRG